MLTASGTSSASPQALFAALVDVEDWPNWTESMDSVRRLDDGPLRVGSKAEIHQPKLGTNTFEVTELVTDVEFTWQAHNPGVVTIGRHVLTPTPDGTRVDLSLEQTGPLAWLARLLTDKTSRTFVDMELRGLLAAGASAPADPGA